MAKKPVIRFAIKANGKLKQLFAVRERSDGDLAIVMKPALFSEVGDTHQDLIEDRWSIHPSQRADPPAVTITHTHNTKQGFNRKDASMVRYRDTGHFLWTPFTQRSADLSPAHYDCVPGPNDKIVDMGDYDPRTSSLMYSLIISTTNNWYLEALRGMGTVHDVSLIKYKVAVLSCFHSVPSLPNSRFNGQTTSLPRINGHVDDIWHRRPASSRTPKELAADIRMARVFLNQQFISVATPLVPLPLIPVLHELILNPTAAPRRADQALFTYDTVAI